MSHSKIHTTIDSIGNQRWEQLCGTKDCFLNYDYLAALESSGCVGNNTNWHPHHLVLSEQNEPVAAMPMYLKNDSYGEFVFDWGWAQAAQSAGIPYYPKLVSSIPYTPVTGPRMTSGDPHLCRQLLEGVVATAETTEASSWHLLFPNKETVDSLMSIAGNFRLLTRNDCHFVWFNRDYASFDDFLAGMNSRKRKSIRRERRKVAEQGVILNRYAGSALSPQLMMLFYEFYQIPYQRRGRSPYLNLEFFQQLFERMQDRLMLVVATREHQPVGAALFVCGDNSLSGRWWGGLPSIDCLHFEACYYQGIEYAIEKGFSRFDPGIQGEHKLLRGFEPEITHSLHWIKDPRLSDAVEKWLAEERKHVGLYQQQARQHLPYKQP
ncbi:GNAT family N-acetyltransferase [Motiliproteus sp. MSK22-1]|uniref:GNAT family N-acetyltransferase n=1 Tax=Motiliproteus sp. MSK22-1 TaxID=1897630 RepID=UPI000975FF4E|nr:GNAT family N-acetyltransferase [Motiliproteus sp. MSK22-1]OMH33639.1 hypothetical protein BGP75_11520 [Motiliproteus sp. MSK22-1]